MSLILQLEDLCFWGHTTYVPLCEGIKEKLQKGLRVHRKYGYNDSSVNNLDKLVGRDGISSVSAKALRCLGVRNGSKAIMNKI